MDRTVDVRKLDERMYALTTAAAEIDQESEACALIRGVVDQMREQRAALRAKTKPHSPGLEWYKTKS